MLAGIKFSMKVVHSSGGISLFHVGASSPRQSKFPPPRKPRTKTTG